MLTVHTTKVFLYSRAWPVPWLRGCWLLQASELQAASWAQPWAQASLPPAASWAQPLAQASWLQAASWVQPSAQASFLAPSSSLLQPTNEEAKVGLDGLWRCFRPLSGLRTWPGGGRCIAQHSTTQHSTARHGTAQHSTAQQHLYVAAQHSTAWHGAAKSHSSPFTQQYI